MKIEFSPIVSPKQGNGPRVVCFAAAPEQIIKLARVDRIGRDAKGKLTGFQRPQIAAHIREIRDYLKQENAILPNAIVLAFGEGAHIKRGGGSFSVDISEGPPGWVVDGQQRLMAALGVQERKFELLVSAFICPDADELNRQFILINNTRPLAKPLIYELLPNVHGLPHRLSDRTDAARLTEELNYARTSSLFGLIRQQTNPDGIIKDTLIQKLLINSLQHGGLRGVSNSQLVAKGYELVSEFFWAVRQVFAKDWEAHTSKTSRLLHGAGLISLGYVMDELAVRDSAKKRGDFVRGMRPLAEKTFWSSGTWNFGVEKRAWNSIQNTNADYRLLSHYLVRLLRTRRTRS